MTLDKKKINEATDRHLKLHGLAVFVAVLMIGVLIGSIVNAGPAQRNQCNDGMDNDGDNKIDYPNDPGCSSKSDKSELNSNVQCDDGMDNDGDGKRDYPSDTGCSSLTDTSERGTLQCDNGKDDDNDGKIDYPNDPGCTNPSDSSEDDPVLNSCFDSDFGFNIYVQGTVNGTQNGQSFSNTDYCFDENVLVEYQCYNNGPYSYTYTCQANQTTGSVCVQGACV